MNPPTKLFTLSTSLALIVLSIISVEGDVLTVLNHSFESDVLARDGNTATVATPGDDFNADIVPASWLGFDDGRGGTGGNRGLVSHANDSFFNASLTNTPDADANDQSFFTAARDIYQVLGDTLAANTQYTLTIDIGDRDVANVGGNPGTPIINLGYGATAGTNNLLVMNQGNQPTQVNGGWVTWTGTFTTGDTPTGLGQAIRIDLTTGENVGWFDDVRVEATPATTTSFTATPNSFVAGDTVTLNWNTPDADSVTIDNGIGAVATTGSTIESPSATTTWTLTVVKGGVITTTQATASLTGGAIDVYLLGGQSNMQGVGRHSKLPAELMSIPEIQLYHSSSVSSTGGSGHWITLRPAGFDANSFGPEIGFGEIIKDLCPSRNIALIKHAVGGTNLANDWNPGADASDTGNWGGQFTTFVNTANNAITALEAAGYTPIIHGMIWQQGERDARTLSEYTNYGTNLEHFIGRIREQFASHASPSGIRFVAGQVLPYAPAGGQVVTDYPGYTVVRQATLDTDEDSGATISVTNTGIVPTNSVDHPTHEQEIDGYRDTDEVHLNAVAQLALGRSMAYEMFKASPVTYAEWALSHSLVGGENDDDDSDGVANLTEFYYGSSPMNPASVSRATGKIETIGGHDYHTISFLRNLDATGLTHTPQVSEDLLNWNSSTPPVFVHSLHNGNGTATLLYRSPWSLTEPEHPRVFLRLLITN